MDLKMQYIGNAMNEFPVTEKQGSTRGRMGRRRAGYDDTNVVYISKNLHAERRRREKLSQRLLQLRSLVPIITEMNKGTIVEDAITYVRELQGKVQELTGMLNDMESLTISEEEGNTARTEEVIDPEEMNKLGIKEDVEVMTNIDGNKLWVKISFEEKRGRFTRLLEKMACFGLELTDTSVTTSKGAMEKMACFGLELTDTSITTSKGAMLVTACVQGAYVDTLTAHQTKELLLHILKGI